MEETDFAILDMLFVWEWMNLLPFLYSPVLSRPNLDRRAVRQNDASQELPFSSLP